MEFLQEERRKHFRCKVPYSAFEYKGRRFDIINISAGGILVKNQLLAEESEKLLAELQVCKEFAFNLTDRSSNSTLPLFGSVIRIIKDEDQSIASFAVKFLPPRPPLTTNEQRL